jgi:peptidoglycan/xylan/chitin deacetylase (PgdA/CDA1 family)
MGAVFTCSIDDGHPSDMKAAELLNKHGMNGTFFIPVKNSEGSPVLSRAQLLEIGVRFEIGSHTFDHLFLKNADAPTAQYQIEAGKSRLEDMIGREVDGFCYPGGKYGRQHINMVRSAGFRYARTTENLCFSVGERPLQMPTTVQFYPHDRSVYLRNFVKQGNWIERRTGLLLALRHKDWIKRLYTLFEHANREEKLFHLWFHSEDIDKLNAWKMLDHFLGHVAERVAICDRLSNGQLAAYADVSNAAVLNAGHKWK